MKTPSLISWVKTCFGLGAQQNAGRHLGTRETCSGGTAGAENHLLRSLDPVFLPDDLPEDCVLAATYRFV